MRLKELLIFFIFLASCLNLYGLEEDVIELTDKNFEELTQVSSGNTTGSWFIKFYAPWCVHCKAISRTWSELATELKNQINIAKIDVTVNEKTRIRFKIDGFPTLLYFRNGKMYDYKAHDRTLEALKNFVLESYKSMTPSETPQPLGFYDLIINHITEMIGNISKIYKHAFPCVILIGSISFLFGIIMTYFLSKFAKCVIKKIYTKKVHKQAEKEN